MIVDTWKSVWHWELILPPSRPSVVELNRIRTILESISRSEPVAVLGSTPEFRDLLHEYEFERIHILERNIGFYESMSAYRIYQNSETFVHGNWLETLGGFRGFFSLILSDLTSGNIPYDHRGLFYQLITSSLKVGGIFCDKVLTHPAPHLRPNQVARKYEDLPLNLISINHFSCEMLFCSELLDINNTVDSSHFYSVLEQRITHPRVRAFVAHAERITPKNCIWWYGKKWDQLLPEYCPDLSLVSISDDSSESPYFGRAKHCIFIRRLT